jgi:ComF family protein
MKQWAENALDILLPRHCILCGRSSGPANICTDCSLELPRIEHACIECSQPLSHPVDRICGRCQSRPAPWDFAIAALAYEFPVSQLVRRFKFARSLASGQLLAQELCKAVERQCTQWPDVIIPVPLHRSRLIARAFNQSELLAKHAGKSLQIRVDTRLLLRKRRTRAHSGLDANSRRSNIRGAFKVRALPLNQVPWSHVALVDDVMTTGATLAECTRTLKATGVKHVSVWVASRAPGPASQPLE